MITKFVFNEIMHHVGMLWIIISNDEMKYVFGEGKYSPSVDPDWKAGSARFLDFYKALVNEPDPGVRRDLCKVARSRFREQGGLAHIFQ